MTAATTGRTGGIPRGPRALLLAAGGLALLLGLTGALVLLGLPMPRPSVVLAAGHGPLMALGFLGTMIALERAVALGRTWGYAAPLASALGALALAVLGPGPVPFALFSLAGGVFVAIYVAFARIEPSLHLMVQAVGATGWLGAALLLGAGRPVGTVVPFLAAFLVLTIVGERLELSRVVRTPRAARRAFVAIVVAFGVGVVASPWLPDAGVRVAGVGLVGLGLWLARYDLARRTIRTSGVTRFIAAALLPGYAWLALAGATWAAGGLVAVGGGGSAAGYDVAIHALFLGFVMSMVFGHAPVILPGVLALPLPYHRRFYAHLGLLHAGLLLRVAGDVLGATLAWQAGGVLNVTALLVFLVSSVAAVLGTRDRAAGPISVPAPGARMRRARPHAR
ncbi:MAG TPA: hypothetical protein VFS32_15295 [Candidatus Limnocylindrales bacterium]|nr:hypothetical protein [Candidatus Limnocylindrales bacterium]